MKSVKFTSTFLFCTVVTSALGLYLIPHLTDAFVQESAYSAYNSPGLFSGIWHGLLAPYSLVARWFLDDVTMYAIPNTGWFYDAGFLVGVAFSIPVGWIAAILSTIGHIFL